MRIRNTLKNIVYAMGSYIILAILTLLVRKIFVNSLPVELLGYEGLFGNIFALFALADLGVDSVILYRLFPAFSSNDKKSINKLMSVLRVFYVYVGIAILIVSLLLIPFLKYIISGNSLEWSYVYVIYFIQLIMTLSTYFLGYKRLMFKVSGQ